MKLLSKPKATFSIFPTILFFLFFSFFFARGTIFLSAFFANFVVSLQNVDVSLSQLETSDTEFTISFAPSSGVNNESYHIRPSSHCNSYDENFECLDPAPNLCSYVALQPKNEEVTEVGFSPNTSGAQALGQLNRPLDLTDNWILSIKSPCFEGECAPDYDESQNGPPLPQSEKGQTFKCDLFVETNDEPVIIGNYLEKNIAYADDSANTIEISASFTGELVDCTADCFSNVLFLPGLKASRLYKSSPENSGDQLWEPDGNSDVEYLYLNTDGSSKNSNVYTKEIIEEANLPIPVGKAGPNIYKSFVHMMDVLFDDHKIAEWKAFPYDWRQSVDDIVNNGTKYEDGTQSLTDTLQSLVDSSLSGKVTIIAHSNGGLLAKALLKKLQEDKSAGRNNLIDSVDVLILVAVPEIGTAVAVPAMLHGYDQQVLGGLLIDESHARELGRNMLGAFGLLPSKEYIDRVSASPVTFVDNVIPSNATTNLVQAFGGAINSYAEYKDFLFGAESRTDPQVNQINLPISLSQSLFSASENLHDSIDAFTPPASLRVIEIAGWGLDTIASFEYYPRLCTESLGCGYTLDERPRFTIDGDGTVVVPSAQYMSSNGNAEKYWVDFKNYNTLFKVNRKHAGILEVDSLNSLIQSVIEEKDITLGTVLKDSEPANNSNILRLSIHSPVTIDAYDAENNHTGKTCPPGYDFCYAEENIVNSSYLEFGEGKYINLPEDEFSKIKLQGTDVGTFTYNSEKVLPNGTFNTSSFVDIPVTTQTQAEVTLNQTGTPQMALDVTGDGVTDFTLAPSATFDPIKYLQIMKATIDSLDLPPAKIKAFDNRVDNIIKSIQSGKINKAKLTASKFKSFLEKKLSKPDPKKPKPKKLSKTDAQLFLDMLNKLLDNIN